MGDDRFENIKKDAKFRSVPKRKRTVQIDTRFQSMFKDEKFKEERSIDERGRPIARSAKQELKQFYHQGSSSEEDMSGDENDTFKQNHPPEKDFGNKKLNANVEAKLKNLKMDYARGQVNLFSESSSDDEESDDDFEVEHEGEIEHKWGELDAEADTTEVATKRLAVCNMDWDRIRAADLMVLLNSFLPAGGMIENIKLYLSEFGKKRLSEEEVCGPAELRETKEDEGEEVAEGTKYHMEKLRQYQLNRLKYYYAVVTFDDVETANKIYTDCDGMEYESSATKMDLRFIPDDMQFEEEPQQICDKMPDMSNYQPRFFITTALQQAKVNLTWDETNLDRVELSKKISSCKLDDIDNTELETYVAFSDERETENEDSESDIDDSTEKYKILLEDINRKENEKKSEGVQMEITWGLALEKKSEEIIKKKLMGKESIGPFQQYLNKRKEKRKQKKLAKQTETNNSDDDSIPSDIDMDDPYFAEEFDKPEFKKRKSKKNKKLAVKEDRKQKAELELLLLNEDTNNKQFSLKKIQKQDETSSKTKKKKTSENEKEDDFEVNITDPRFSAVFSSHHYNIDPTDPHYKKTQGMEKLINEKLKRRAQEDKQASIKKTCVEKIPRRNAELSMLVKTVKRNTMGLKQNK